MTIVRIQGNARATTETDTLTIVLTSAPLRGSVLVLVTVCAHDGDPTPTIASVVQANVVWSRQVSSPLDTPWGSAGNEIWAGVVGAGASDTITITYGTTPFYAAVGDVCEYSGILNSGFLDKTASDAANGGPPALTGTTAVTSQGDELWVGCVSSGVALVNALNSFTLLDGTTYSHSVHGGTIALAYLEKIVALVGQANSGTNEGSGWYAGCIATFKAEAVAAICLTGWASMRG